MKIAKIVERGTFDKGSLQLRTGKKGTGKILYERRWTNKRERKEALEIARLTGAQLEYKVVER